MNFYTLCLAKHKLLATRIVDKRNHLLVLGRGLTLVLVLHDRSMEDMIAIL